MATATQTTARRWACTTAEYHADGANSVSHSELDVFIQSPTLYHGRYRSGEFPREESDSLEFGAAFHAVLLDGVRVADAVVKIPADVLTSNGQRRGKAWEEFQAEHGGHATLLLPADYERFCTMLRSIDHEPAARRVFADAVDREASIVWTDRETRVVCRCRLDVLTEWCVADLKTTASVNPKQFSAAAYRFGYHRQAAWYLDGYRALYGDSMPFVFVAVEKKPPFTCAVFELDAEFIRQGQDENRAALRKFADCQRRDSWEPETRGLVVSLAPPAWAKYESDWNLTKGE